VYVDVDDYLLPPEYWLADLAHDNLADWELLDRWPTQFDATPYAVKRGHARSADGTRVPYTVIGPRSLLESTRQAGQAGSARPCLLTGYGGFAIPLTPSYLTGPGIGCLWSRISVAVANLVPSGISRRKAKTGSVPLTISSRSHRRSSTTA
jgi:prolyl oligopeptidase